MYKKYYTRFLQANTNVLHFACHSHHYWPDVTRDAMLEYWDDCAKYVDEKWTHFFSTKLPQAQKLIAEIIDVEHPEQIVFAPNTHEFVYRLLSSLPRGKKKTILTTDSEFLSFDRQINRCQESDEFEVIKVPTLPFENFKEAFLSKLKEQTYDMVFISQVFYNSGLHMDFIDEIADLVGDQTTLVLDGYHSFMALPFSLKKIQDKVYFLAGGYKYAQGGEGCCFLYSPKGSKLRPEYTGWFAGFGELDKKQDGNVHYTNDGMRFAGSTMDYSAIYRLIATLTLFKNEGITVSDIHKHVQEVQKSFLEKLDQLGFEEIKRDKLIASDLDNHGHFLTFDFEEELTAQLAAKLKEKGVITDYRGRRLRFGFGMYHEAHEVPGLKS